jgi:hypothetical protein
MTVAIFGEGREVTERLIDVGNAKELAQRCTALQATNMRELLHEAQNLGAPATDKDARASLLETDDPPRQLLWTPAVRHTVVSTSQADTKEEKTMTATLEAERAIDPLHAIHAAERTKVVLSATRPPLGPSATFLRCTR